MLTVLDTNIILLDANNILTVDGITVIPETVVDELDNKKSGFSEIAYQARAFGRLLANAETIGIKYKEDLVINTFLLEGKEIWIVSSTTYPNYSDTEKSIINDRKIIEIAYQLKQLNEDEVIFVSNDVMCRVRASSLALEVADIKDVAEAMNYTSINF